MGLVKPSRIWPDKTRELTKILMEQKEEWIRIRMAVNGEAVFVELNMDNSSGEKICNRRDTLVRLDHVRRFEKIAIDISPCM